MRTGRRVIGAVMVAAAVWAARPAGAQVLADRLPADTVVYVGWAGTDALGPAYEKSHMKGLIDTLKLPELVAAQIAAARQQARPEQAAEGQLLEEWMAATAKAPTAMALRSIDFTRPGRPVPQGAIASKVGAAAAAPLAERLSALISRNPRPDAPPVGAVARGDYLVLYMGDPTFPDRFADQPPADALATSDRFKTAMAQVGDAARGQAVTMYVDGEAMLGLVGEAVAAAPGGGAAQLFPAVSEAMGLSALRQAAWAGGFDGANWRSAAFVGMSARRTGLLAFFDAPPLKPDALALIPRSAVAAGVWRFDGDRLLTDVVNAAPRFGERGPQAVETAFRQFYAFTGVELRKELLPSLGDEWIYYASPDATGVALRGFTVVNRLKDPQKADSALSAAENFINLLILQQSPNSKAQFKTEPLPAPFDKVSAHVIAVDTLTPCWAISDGLLFMSMSTQGLQSAIEQARGGKPGFGENAPFMALRKALGQDAMASFGFVDLPKLAPEYYELTTRALAQAAATDPAITYTLPPLDKMMPDLGPALSVYWTDDAGFHLREAGPVPFAGYLSPVRFLTLRLAEMVEGGRRRAPAAPAGGGALP